MDPSDVTFNYATSNAKGGACTDVASNTVESADVLFNYAGSTTKGGAPNSYTANSIGAAAIDSASLGPEIETEMDLAQLRDHDIDSLSGQSSWDSAVTKKTTALTIESEINLDGSSEGMIRLPSSPSKPSCIANNHIGRIYHDTDEDGNGSVMLCTAGFTWKDIDDDGGGTTDSGSPDVAGAFELCRGGTTPGWDYDLTTNTYGATCGNFAWSAIAGGVSGGAATPASYVTATTNGGNAFDISCSAIGAGTGSDGTTYNVATKLQPGNPADAIASGGSTTTLVDAGQVVTANAYRDHIVKMTSGGCNGVRRRIISSTGTDPLTLTIDGTWDSGYDACTGSPTGPVSGDAYIIYDDVGAACWAAGESVRMNWMADAMLAQDHTRPGGMVYFPIATGKNHRIYVHRGCGRKGNASTTNAPNNCPVLRHPHDTNYVHVLQQIGNIAWRFEGGPDFDAAQNGRHGAWIVDDTGSIDARGGDALDGRDAGGPSPGTKKLKRTAFRIGPAAFDGSTERRCFANASGDCQPGSSSNDGITSNTWGWSFSIVNTGDVTDETAICVSNSKSDSGTCRDDRRVQCAQDSDCSAVGLAATCESAVAAIEYETETLHKVLRAWINLTPADFPETGGSTGGSEASLAQIISAPRSTSGCTNGETIAADSFKWPVRASKIPAGTGSLVIIDDNESDGGLTGGWSGYTWSPNNYYGRDLDNDTVSDPGDCLSGGDGSATNDEPECDDAEGPTLYGGMRHVISNAVHAYCSAVPTQGGFSCFDGDTLSFNQQANGLIVHNPKRGYLGDLSDVRMRDFVLRDCPFSSAITGGVNTAFVSFSRVDGFTIENCHVPTIISTGSARSVRITNGEFIGTSGTAIQVLSGNGVQINNLRFASHRGLTFEISPWTELGSITIANIVAGGRMQFSGAAGAPPEAFISWSRLYATSGHENPLRQLTIDNVHVSTVTSNGCLLWLDDDTSPAEGGPIETQRRKITLQNSSIDGLNGATGQRVVCVDVIWTNETGDCWLSSGGVCDALDDQGIFTQRYTPVLRNNFQNGVPFPDQPWPVMNASEAGDCDDVGRVGSTVRIVDDTSAGACADGGGDGILDGTGTAVSVCVCRGSTVWGEP